MKRMISVFLIAVLLLTGCVSNTGAATWQEQYDLGVRYLSEGNYEEAVLAFKAAIEIEPKKAEAYLSLADTYMELGDPALAEQILLTALDAVEDAQKLEVIEKALETVLIFGKREQILAEQQREGLWVSEDGTSYVGIFPNGQVLSAGDAVIREGTWEAENENTVTVSFCSAATAESGEWTYTYEQTSGPYMYDMQISGRYTYDVQTGQLISDDGMTFVPTVDYNAFWACGEYIEKHADAGGWVWMTQQEMNFGFGRRAALWSGLERTLYEYLLKVSTDTDTLEESEYAWEEELRADRERTEKAYEGGSMMSMAVSGGASVLTQIHVCDLLVMLPDADLSQVESREAELQALSEQSD